MRVFEKQGVSQIDYYVNGGCKRERIGPDKRLAETVLRKCKVAMIVVYKERRQQERQGEL